MSSKLSAIELLKLGNDDRTVPVLNKIWPQFIGAIMGGSTAAYLNYATQRPAFSGIQKYVLFIGGWMALLTFANQKRNDYYAEKDAVLRHYIELHPEEFKEPPKKKIGDIFEPWIPIR